MTPWSQQLLSSHNIRTSVQCSPIHRTCVLLSSVHQELLPNHRATPGTDLKMLYTYQWTPAREAAMTLLKEKLTIAPVLAFPAFTVETDVSISGIRAVLLQRQDDGKLHPVAYTSRSLTLFCRMQLQCHRARDFGRCMGPDTIPPLPMHSL